MNFVKWHAAHAAQNPRIANPFNNLVDDFFFRAVGSDSMQHSIPAVNITESSEAFIVELAAPGYQKEQFKLRTEKNALTVEVVVAKGEQKESNATEAEVKRAPVKWLRREFSNQSFSRTFRLADNVNVQAIVATYQNGILTLTLPKKLNDEAWTREISVA